MIILIAILLLILVFVIGWVYINLQTGYTEYRKTFIPLSDPALAYYTTITQLRGCNSLITNIKDYPNGFCTGWEILSVGKIGQGSCKARCTYYDSTGEIKFDKLSGYRSFVQGEEIMLRPNPKL